MILADHPLFRFRWHRSLAAVLEADSALDYFNRLNFFSEWSYFIRKMRIYAVGGVLQYSTFNNWRFNGVLDIPEWYWGTNVLTGVRSDVGTPSQYHTDSAVTIGLLFSTIHIIHRIFLIWWYNGWRHINHNDTWRIYLTTGYISRW